MSKEQVDEIAQGRVWTGADAKKQNLVDVIGGIDTAVDLAAEKAGIEDYQLAVYPEKQDLYQLLMGNAQATAGSFMPDNLFKSSFLQNTKNQLQILKQRGALALFPYEVTIQ